MTAIPVDHHGGCHAFRLDWPNHSMAYVTDTVTKKEAEYVPQIRGVDTLIHECYFPDDWEEKAELTGHSCLTPVAEVARADEANDYFSFISIRSMNQKTPLGRKR